MGRRSVAATAACLIALLVVAACAVKIAPEDVRNAQAVFQQLHRGDLADVKGQLVPEAINPNTDAQLSAVASLIPAQAPQAVRTVGYNVVNDQSSGVTSVSVTQEWSYPNEVLVVATAFRKTAGKPIMLTGMHIQPMSAAAMRALDFSLVGKSPLHYILLVWAVLTPLLMIAALVALYRSTIKPKWLWTIFVVVGVGGLSLNWATGATELKIGVQLLGSGIVKYNAVFAPWILSVSFPLGAIIVLFRVLRRRRPEPSAVEDEPAPASG